MRISDWSSDVCSSDLGVVLLFGLGGTTTLEGLADSLIGADRVGLIAASSLVIVGLAFKLGAVPVHAWVPDVADGAPGPIAALVTTAPKVDRKSTRLNSSH